MRVEVQNQIKMLGNAVAAEVTSTRHSHRRWLQLSPHGSGIQLLEVEVPVGLDPTDWPTADADHVIVSSETFESLDDALAALSDRNVDTNAFDAIWKSENPF